jgi:hypothetical protein
MKNVAIGILVLLLVGFAAKQFFSPKAPSPQPEPTGYKFYYYPKLNVYYDATQDNFVYSVDGGVSWQTKRPVNQRVPDQLSDKVVIYSPVPNAWIYNAEHRDQYKGVLSNFVMQKEDTALVVVDTISKKEDTSQKKKRIEAPKEEKKKGGFFKRLKEKIKKGFKKRETDTTQKVAASVSI